VSVLRGASPSELRPYQRALTGSSGRERFSIAVDSSDYEPQSHNLIGFGESGIKKQQTTRQFLADTGVSEGSVEALLVSYGLDTIGDKMCSDLTADEERRVRLVAASCEPNKILIVNEPFEPIDSSWRERFAELLVSFARSQGGLVIIPSLSYRPESWIENDSITRIEVGQTAQKTIGFQVRSATTTKLMQQLRSMFGDEKIDRLINPESSQSESSASVSTAGILTGAVATGATATTGDSESDTAPRSIEAPTPPKASHRTSLYGALALALMLLGGVVLIQTNPGLLPNSAEDAPTPGPSTNGISQATEQFGPSGRTEPVANNPGSLPAEVVEMPTVPPPPVEQPTPAVVGLVLDNYPEDIRRALLDTAQGLTFRATSDSAEQPSKPREQVAPSSNSSGNLFKLLENASSKEGDTRNDAPPPPNFQQQPYEQESPEDMEARREAIRQKFLEAIRSASDQQETE
jgi:ABC-type transport system involved in cytochrome c biogenesis ATPase subunit